LVYLRKKLKINRTASDAKAAEADAILKQIEALES
jgi:hypothetical protein